MREVFYAMLLSGACAITALVAFGRAPPPDEALCAAPAAPAPAPAPAESEEDVQMSVTVRRIPL